MFADRGSKERAISVFGELNYIFGNEPAFIRMYATYCWSTVGHRLKAIDVLLDYFSRSHGTKNEANLDLFARLITMRSSYWLERRQETKEHYRLGEISLDEYGPQMEEQRKQFQDIFRAQGFPFFVYIRSHDFDEFSSSTRMNIIAGLYQLAEICIRTKKFDTGRDICEYAMATFGETNHHQFQYKLQRINEYAERETYHDSER